MKLTQKLAVAYVRARFRILSAISVKKAAAAAFELFCTPPTRDVPGVPELYRQAEELRFRFLHYEVVGYRWNKGGHRKVLILHGFESTVINFAMYVPPLVAKGYEVLAFDAPAHGRSSGKQITALEYRDMVKYVHENYGPVHSYMGHSFGGFALSMALAEMKHDDSWRVVFIAPASETSTAIDRFFQFLRLGDNVRKEFEKIILEKGGHPVSWFTVGRTIPLINAKILWLHDEKDTVTPLKDALKVKNQNHPHVQFVITSGLGHSRIYRDAGVVDAVVAFL